MTQKALIVVDIEKEWSDPYSDCYVGDISGTLERTNRLIDYCRSQGYRIIFTRHIEEDSEDVFREDSQNVELVDGLHREESDPVITKYRISPFFRTDLDERLQGVQELVVCGILTNLCVRTTIEAAYDRDFDIHVIMDCCVAFDEQTQEFTFADLKSAREEIQFVSLDDFMGGS